MHRRTPLASLALAAATLPFLATGCNKAEIARLETQAAALQAKLDGVAAEKAEQAAALGTATAELATANAELSTARADLEAERAAAETLRRDGKKSQSDLEKKLEKEEKRHRETASHRDELVEWIEKDLLPIAEEQDPRLANLRAITDEMAKEVERLRGLEFKRPFMRRLIDRDDVSKFMRRDMERELPREEADKMMKVLAEFGIVDKDVDLYDMFEEFLEAGAAAFYKPNTGTFYLIEGKNDRGDRPIVFHELVHALEDQHFDLTTMARAAEDDSDGGMGYKALVEGSAEYHTNLYTAENPEDLQAMMKAQMTPELMQRQLQMLDKVPAFLIAMMGLYPYKNGAAWIEGIGATSPEAVSGLFGEPPASTEQVLHPEKHGKDFPHVVGAPEIGDLLGDGWEVLDDDSVGELGCGLVLSALKWTPKGLQALLSVMDPQTQGVGFKPPVKSAAEGWDGDRYTAAIDADGNVCIVWSSFWDSEKDAQEFAEVYGGLLGQRTLGKKPDAKVEMTARFSREAGAPVSGLQVSGKLVATILSAPADKAEALIESALSVEVTPDARDANDQ